MWPFNAFKKKKNAELRSLVTAFAILEEFAKRGLIYWKERDNMLLIEASLASEQLSRGAKAYRNFLDQVVLWQNFRLVNAAYEQRQINIEAAAVRDAKRRYATLTNADIARIRQMARSQMEPIDPDEMPVVKEFDILIIRTSTQSITDGAEADKLLAIGHYDGETLDMALYDDVCDQLHADE